MPIENDVGGGSGGGSTTSICTVNPSDSVAIINNLISRISDIERFLSQLVGADVHADNLAELADNIGNILNGTITLPSDGNSPYGEGGSIPVPDNFNGTVISGNVTTIWTNGVVSFQVDNSGIVVGGGGGGVKSYLVVQPSTATFSSNRPVLNTIKWNVGSAFGTSNLGTGQIDINETGYYHFSATLQCGHTSTPTTFVYMQVLAYDPTTTEYKYMRDGQGVDANDTNLNITCRVSFGFPATAGSYFQISFVGMTGLINSQLDYSGVTVEKLA